MAPETPASPAEIHPSRSGSHIIAMGIMLSRVMGLVRQKIFAHYFGNSDAGDAFYAALKIPNFPQNLLGDGVLSASFVPVYASLSSQGNQAEADRVAGVIGSILAVINGVLVFAGVLAAPYMIDLIAPGFHDQKRELTIRMVQIFFPGTGLLVMSAWCMGILNSHKKFFLSYAAPVIWNVSIIISLLVFGHRSDQNTLAIYTAWGVLIGSILQFAFQLPSALKYAPLLKWGFDTKIKHVREILKNLVPVVIARGVVQISAYIDNVMASLLPTGAVSALAYTQSLYMLPISLFGMSVSAAELTTMSRFQGSQEEISAHLRTRINAGSRQISFFIIPSVVGFLFLGDVIVGGLFQGGEFSRANTEYVWGVLAGSTFGLLASTLGRLYSSAFYSMKDTRLPLRLALLRVFLTTVLGYIFGFVIPPLLHIEASWGTAGLTASAGLAGWIEFLLLRKNLRGRVGHTGLAFSFLAKLWLAALIAGSAGWFIKTQLGHEHPLITMLLVLAPYGLIYFAATYLLGLAEVKNLFKRFLNR